MSIEDDIALLEAVPMLHMLGRDALRAIAISADNRPLSRGEVLFREGQFAEAAFVVASGTISVAREDAHLARRPGQTIQVGRGALLGEMALLTETKRPATATAVEPSAVLRIPRVIFMRTIEGYPDVAVRLTQALSERVQATLAELDAVRHRLDAIEPAPRRPR
ncbi:Crp/Fnr family transcriptional regulator [Ancylobacter radicis]|uniref:Crp/Fnr family transcriptional regulator n=1 Tax=Ancylobacter radicis TaxID=2836179 RepID=A0ABS5R8P9_9HYPH|nr:Crp/Fnr family transcriptional regulator [Ancylobacter radicis]MBS9477497.1 Crp/Fnr family transcriptional regulator [Ancylobacter radicis]